MAFFFEPPHGCILLSVPRVRPRISDDVLLAIVCKCGATGDLVTLQCRLSGQIGAAIDAGYLVERLERLHHAGLVRTFQPAHANRRFHLTQTGIDRLEALQHEPAVPATK